MLLFFPSLYKLGPPEKREPQLRLERAESLMGGITLGWQAWVLQESRFSQPLKQASKQHPQMVPASAPASTILPCLSSYPNIFNNELLYKPNSFPKLLLVITATVTRTKTFIFQLSLKSLQSMKAARHFNHMEYFTTISLTSLFTNHIMEAQAS